MPYLSLILVPVIAYLWACKVRSKYTWRITGATFGAVVYPFFTALTLPLLYMGRVGLAIVDITNPIGIFHRTPGKAIYFLLKGHSPDFRGTEQLWLFALNAVVWGIVYGAMGWYVDRDPDRNKIKIPFLLLAIPVLYNLIIFLKLLVPASVEIVNQAVNSSNYGTICRQVIDAEPKTAVWITIGSLKGGFSILRAVEGEQFCETVTLEKGPFQVISGSILNPQIVLDIPVAGGGKTCIGLAPTHKGASLPNTGWSADWSAKVIECVPR
jgi:hypothetical protein